MVRVEFYNGMPGLDHDFEFLGDMVFLNKDRLDSRAMRSIILGCRWRSERLVELGWDPVGECNGYIYSNGKYVGMVCYDVSSELLQIIRCGRCCIRRVRYDREAC